ncbi:AAA family ATPase [Algibacter luteus]|uniref:AAA family ATPase n=1 Tax=Algibacter luteus TaxID=1178825 RepID=UPI002599BCEF|nr:AAA family ATPase [Algibacter luteus]WJJ98234.1 AAA family ATPase [Algibacter luteus]
MNQKLDFVTKELIDRAVLEIDKNGIPTGRMGTKYAVTIKGKNYPFKLLITEAAKLVGVNLTANDFSSNKHYRLNLEEMTGYPVIELNNKVTFKNLKELVDIINTTLGEFCSEFQYKRKELLKMGSATNRDKLFINSNDSRDWVINPGGGTEFQYHLFLRDNVVCYGLGFNTQYVPFANKKSPVEYIQPYVDSFLANPNLYKNLKDNGFEYVIGDENHLKNLVYDNYVLIGSKIEVIKKEDVFELSDAFFQEMISNLKGILFETYKEVISNMKTTATRKYSFEKMEKLFKEYLIKVIPNSVNNYLSAVSTINRIGIDANILNETLYEVQDMSSYETLMASLKKVEEYKERNRVGHSMFSSSLKKYKGLLLELESMNTEITKSIYEQLLYQKKQIILQGPPGTGKTYTGKDIAERIIFPNDPISSDKRYQKNKLEASGQFKLVQFHPSYTYEDFIRGITAKSEGEHISYDTENKTLALLAEEANINLIASKKDVEDYSKEEGIKDLLIEFSESVQDKIDENEDYKITEAVSIVAVEEDAFRYTGKWKTSQRMKFKDLVSAILQNVNSRQEFKRLDSVSGLARQHATYFFKVLEQFKKEFGSQLNEAVSKRVSKPLLKNYVLIIDEINRANLPSVLGELIYALEYRGEAVDSMYAIDGDAKITIPENLYIIGTMNTADRSVGHIDYAIKRRFAFVDMLPNAEVITNDKAKTLFNIVSELFTEKYLASDFESKDVHLGHSYFILDENSELSESEQLQLKLDYEIMPILNEYVKDGLLLETAKEKLKEIAKFEC